MIHALISLLINWLHLFQRARTSVEDNFSHHRFSTFFDTSLVPLFFLPSPSMAHISLTSSLFRSQRGSRTISIRIITCLQHSCAKRSTRCTGHGPPTLPPMVHTSFLSSTAYLILITVVTVPLPLRYHSCLSCLIRSLPHVVTVVLKTTAQIEVVVTNSEKAFLASPELHEEQYDVVEAMGMHLM